MRRNRGAFTLVELLVVVAIIAVLISILLPALKNARAAAMSVRCKVNLKQSALALYLYSEDWNGYAPSGAWPPPVADYLKLSGPPFPLACPSKRFGTEPLGYYASRPWANNLSLNNFLDDDAIDGHDPDNQTDGGVLHPGGAYWWTMPLRRVQDPSGTVMFYDAKLGSEMVDGYPPYAAEVGWGWSTFDFRHPGSTGNIAFVDQHTESIRTVKSSLWTPVVD